MSLRPAAPKQARTAARSPEAAAPSIRRRLVRAVLALWLICGVAVALAVWLAAHEEVDELLDDTLRASAEVLGALLPAVAGNGVVDSPAADARFAWQVVDAAHRVVLRSAQAPVEPFAPAPVAGFVTTARWRVFGSALGGDGRLLYVAQTRAERSEAQFEVALNTVLAALGIGLLGYLGLRAQLRHELAPLQRLSDRVDRHEPLAGAATLGAAERAEFQSVYSAIDGLGQRLARRLAHERAFSAHAAHALRTPLAGIDAQLAVCLRESPAELQPRLQRVRDAAGRLQRVVVALLALFRSDAEPARQPIDLQGLLAQWTFERLQVQARATQVLNADPDLLAAALMNLLDNAQRHGAARVMLSTPRAQVLRLDDDGPGIAGEQRQAFADALAAQDYDRVPGLGLALADLVARAHGGRLHLPEGASGGFAVELSLGVA
jgi:signal transduction histidine kinase